MARLSRAHLGRDPLAAGMRIHDDRVAGGHMLTALPVIVGSECVTGVSRR